MRFFCHFPNSLRRLWIILVGLIAYGGPAAAQIITTYAGNGIAGYTGDGGAAIAASLSYPNEICKDTGGNLYVMVSNKIRKISTSGIITTVAGNGTYGNPGNGGLAINAFLNSPSSLAADASGNLYLAEMSGRCIRKITAATGIITTIAGNGSGIVSGDGGPAVGAGIPTPSAICVDTRANVYIADWTSHSIRKIDGATGIITTVAGNGLSNRATGDGGPAIYAALPYPLKLCIDANDNIYVLEDFNGVTSYVRRIDAATGLISTVAGNGSSIHTGDGGPAIAAGLAIPRGIAIDDKNNIYISETFASWIRKVNAATGIITTIAGTGADGFSGDGGPAVSAALNRAIGMCAYGGNLYVADGGNNRIRKITGLEQVCTPTIAITASANNICPNTVVTFSATATNVGTAPVYLWKKNGVAVGSNSASYTTADIGNNDVITCILTSNAACVATAAANSNSIVMKRFDVAPEVTTVATATAVCAGTGITFTATNKSESPDPVYTWSVNGQATGTNSRVFTSASLPDGASVVVRMTVPQCGGGSTKGDSDPIVVTVYPLLTPSVTISASAATVCKGSPASFTAVVVQAGAKPALQWKVNGKAVTGANSTVFTTTTLADGDEISCDAAVDATAKCAVLPIAGSNRIVMKVTEDLPTSIHITTPDADVCGQQPVTFTAVAQYAGANPVYQWELNGSKVGSNHPVYTNNSPAHGDKVLCVVTAEHTNCALTSVNVSNTIAIMVRPLPVISISPADTTLMAGSRLQLQASVSGMINTYEWTPAASFTNPLVLDPLTVPLTHTTVFRLKAVANNGCAAEKMTTVNVVTQLYMPNSFTPNRDGKNDWFRLPAGVALQLEAFSVYDRWGRVIFYTSDAGKGWDGSYKGAPAAGGVYIYLIKGTEGSRKVLLKGTVLLVR